MTKFEEFEHIIAKLRAPDGCPWDREQTHASLKKPCIEEAAEVVCGINILEQTGDADNLKEELGDLLLQVVMHARIAEEEGYFTMDDVIQGIIDKMVRRHPHVFGDAVVSGSGEVLTKWDEIKKQEKAGKEWTEAYLPAAFNEAKELIDAAAERKGFEKRKGMIKVNEIKENRTAVYVLRRYLLLCAGLAIMAFGVAFSIKASLGTSPISSVPVCGQPVCPADGRDSDYCYALCVYPSADPDPAEKLSSDPAHAASRGFFLRIPDRFRRVGGPRNSM